MLEEFKKSIENISKIKDRTEYDTCYMSFVTFLELFKVDYNLFRFAGKWYLNNTDIEIEFRDDLPVNNPVIFVNSEFFNIDI